MPSPTSFTPNGRQELKHGITYMDYMLLQNKVKYEMRLNREVGGTIMDTLTFTAIFKINLYIGNNPFFDN